MKAVDDNSHAYGDQVSLAVKSLDNAHKVFVSQYENNSSRVTVIYKSFLEDVYAYTCSQPFSILHLR